MNRIMERLGWKIPTLTISVLIFSPFAYPSNPSTSGDRVEEIRAALKEFEINPALFMQRLPVKRDSQGRVLPSATAFSLEDIRSKQYVKKRDSVRKKMKKKTREGTIISLEQILPGKAPSFNEDFKDLVDQPRKAVTSLQEIENRGLLSGALSESPWSDDYWGIYRGILGARYADPHFPKSNWEAGKKYIDDASFQSILQSQNASSIDRLSPSEKYDLLIGDMNGTLTKKMWSEGEYYFNTYKTVEEWMGICHGWAAAAYVLPRPSHAVKVQTPSGFTIRFYPSDIKGLASLLWAKYEGSTTRFIGGRCDDKDPEKDLSNGRITSENCFDTYPDTFHLALVNQVGRLSQDNPQNMRTFVMDTTYDYEVWNQPVYSYRYSYFNPQTREPAANLRDALIKISTTQSFEGDKFVKYRRYKESNAAYVVGIAMDVTYAMETDPSHALTDSPRKDVLRSTRYLYDLELNESLEPVGGEWYLNAHPDFLWTPEPGARAVSYADRMVSGSWDGKRPLPSDWSKAAKRAAQGGQPLAAIVETLITLSRLSN